MAWKTKVMSVGLLIGLYVLLIAIVNTIHFRFFTVRVVLYDTLFDVLLSGVIVSALYYLYLRHRLNLRGAEGPLSILVGLLIGVIYAISMPTVIDRSLSIYILEKLDQRGGGIRRDAFDQVFKKEYMPEHRLVDIRLTEQLNSGTIRIVGDCVELTDRGRRIVSFTRFYRTHLLPKRREIMGEFTDALTDPFRNSAADVDYRCDVMR